MAKTDDFDTKQYSLRKTSLVHLLANRKWFAATNLTGECLRQLAGNSMHYDRRHDEVNISNIDLAAIKELDLLWRSHSLERFGFSVQKEYWSEAFKDSPPDLACWKNEKALHHFGRQVGWRIGNYKDEHWIGPPYHLDLNPTLPISWFAAPEQDPTGYAPGFFPFYNLWLEGLSYEPRDGCGEAAWEHLDSIYRLL